jgi:hypothetical protein
MFFIMMIDESSNIRKNIFLNFFVFIKLENDIRYSHACNDTDTPHT